MYVYMHINIHVFTYMCLYTDIYTHKPPTALCQTSALVWPKRSNPSGPASRRWNASHLHTQNKCTQKSMCMWGVAERIKYVRYVYVRHFFCNASHLFWVWENASNTHTLVLSMKKCLTYTYSEQMWGISATWNETPHIHILRTNVNIHRTTQSAARGSTVSCLVRVYAADMSHIYRHIDVRHPCEWIMSIMSNTWMKPCEWVVRL